MASVSRRLHPLNTKFQPESKPATIQKFVTQARRCAMEMLTAGSYIQRELPRVEMPETLRDSASQACTQLIATKHDVLSEIFELPEMLEQADESKILGNLDLILRWLGEAVQELHELTNALQAAAAENPQYQSAFFLFAESFTGIVEPFTSAQDAREGLS